MSAFAAGRVSSEVLPFFRRHLLSLFNKDGRNSRRPAIGNVLRRLTTKVLMPSAVSEKASYLLPEQVANGVPAGSVAIIHRLQALMDDEEGMDDDYVAVSIDAKNAFNGYSRQCMLDLSVERVPMLACFVNLL